jgi:hypothetical protein
VIHIEIEPVWHFRREEDGRAMLVMLDFLNEIRATGKITRAAEHAHMSYRHCWNLIEKWAAQRLQARLRPQLQNLAQELETDINEALPQRANIVRVHASHGFAVSKLRELLSRDSDIAVDLRYVSNQNSLVSLAHGGCDLAGVHLPQGELRKKAISAAKQWLIPREHRVIGFVTREMGLMVKRGNPLGIDSLERLLDPAVRFVNRDPDSGTRRLFDQLVEQTKPASTDTSVWNSRMPPSQLTWRAAWPTPASESRPRRASSIWTSSGWSRRTICSCVESRPLRVVPSSAW